MTALIFKIVHAAEWDMVGDLYAGSEKDRADGFLHFSTAEQVPGTLARYYAGARDLVLVAVDEAVLGAALRYEPSRDGALFPHLYAALPVAAVTWVRPIPYDEARGHIPPF
ncbi:MAG TPA: DUF952 domain-containing protein [Rhizomicrobium sp.]|jgi:uncharacterized protein (DUF952 family)